MTRSEYENLSKMLTRYLTEGDIYIPSWEMWTDLIYKYNLPNVAK